MATEYEMLFKLEAALGKTFGTSFSSADKTMSETQKQINQLYATQSDITAYEKQHKAIESTTRKLEDLQKEYDNIQREIEETEGFDSDLENQLIRKQAQIDKTNESLEAQTQKYDELGRKLEDAGVDTDHLTEESERLEAEMSDLADKNEKVGETGVSAFEGIGDAIIATGVLTLLSQAKDLMIETIEGTAQYADNIGVLSTRYHIATDDLQAYYYAAELVDVDVNTMTSSIAKQTKAMYSAQSGTKATQEAYAKLGVEYANADGSLRDSTTVYWEVIDALGRMTNESERDGIAMQLLGRSAMQLNTLIEAGSETMTAYAEEAQNAGYILSGDVLDAAEKLDDTEQRLANQTTALKNAIGSSFSGELMKIKELELQLLEGLTKFVQQNPVLIKTIVNMGTAVGVLIAAYSAYKVIKTSLIAIKKIYALLQSAEIVATREEAVAKGEEAIATEAATVAQEGLNIAMDSCPILLILSAIGAAIGLFVSLASSTDAATESMEAYNEASSIQTNAPSSVENIIGIDSETESKIERTEGLFERLETAMSGDWKSNTGVISTIVDTLNTEYEGLGLTFDKTTGSFNMSLRELSNALESYKVAAVTVTKKGNYDDLLVKEKELRQQLADMGVRLSENDKVIAGTFPEPEDEKSLEAINLYKEFCKVLEEIDAVERGMNAGASGQLGELVIEQMNKLKESYDETYEAAYSSITGQYQLWDTAAIVAATSIGDINNNLQTQTSYWSDYNTDMTNLLGRAGEIEGLSDVIASFADGSEDSVNAIAGMADASDDELKQMVDNWTALKEQQETASESMASLITDYETKIAEYEETLKDCVDELDLSDKAKASAEKTVDSYVQALNDKTANIQAWANTVRGIFSGALTYTQIPTEAHGITGKTGVWQSGYASGTDYATPGLHLVGEEGPELVNFRGGEKVLNADVTAGMLGSGGTTITIAPSFTMAGASSEDVQEASEMLISMVLDALDEKGIDAQRGAYV